MILSSDEAEEKVSVRKDLLKIKDIIGRAGKKGQPQGVEQIVLQLRDLNQRVDDVEKKLKMKKSNSPVILKKKKQIVFLLKQNGKMGSTKLGKLMDLSRTRANEYLKEMEEEGIVEAVKEGRRKLYKLAE